MKNLKIKIATNKDVKTIKNIINQMYGYEYEGRTENLIAHAIDNNKEIYVLAYKEKSCIGFAGASLNISYYADIITPDIAVIDYIYVDENCRSITLAFDIISKLFKTLLTLRIKQAIMQVQTYNKQRFFHYALSDKNIIKTTPIENKDQIYEDQILLIEDLEKTFNMTFREIIHKAHNYKSK